MFSVEQINVSDSSSSDEQQFVDEDSQRNINVNGIDRESEGESYYEEIGKSQSYEK